MAEYAVDPHEVRQLATSIQDFVDEAGTAAGREQPMPALRVGNGALAVALKRFQEASATKVDHLLAVAGRTADRLADTATAYLATDAANARLVGEVDGASAR
ncbi:hypothetical protein Acsp05_23510 [Actinokineospora sp. NBRC 105648]|nr:hypothetical protein Acsp05_23510 [Actinokineospora sp. NBRC 105648]